MSVPNDMNYIEITKPGGPEVLKIMQAEVPTPGDHELLIRVHAACINRPDVIQRSGKYPMKPRMPLCPGWNWPVRSLGLGLGLGLAQRWPISSWAA